MSTLHVIRHAQASMFAANYDELSAKGREQARVLGVALGQRFAAAGRPGFDALFTGPARRHHDTAGLACEGLAAAGLELPELVELPGFDEHDGHGLVAGFIAELGAGEVSLGAGEVELRRLATEAMDATGDRDRRLRAWQLLFEGIMARWLRAEIAPEGVETWAAFRERVLAAFAELRSRARGEIALFTSVGPKAVLLHEVLGIPPQRAFEQAWRLYNTSITRVLYSGERLTLDGFNEVAHLPLGEWTHR